MALSKEIVRDFSRGLVSQVDSADAAKRSVKEIRNLRPTAYPGRLQNIPEWGRLFTGPTGRRAFYWCHVYRTERSVAAPGVLGDFTFYLAVVAQDSGATGQTEIHVHDGTSWSLVEALGTANYRPGDVGVVIRHAEARIFLRLVSGANEEWLSRWYGYVAEGAAYQVTPAALPRAATTDLTAITERFAATPGHLSHGFASGQFCAYAIALESLERYLGLRQTDMIVVGGAQTESDRFSSRLILDRSSIMPSNGDRRTTKAALYRGTTASLSTGVTYRKLDEFNLLSSYHEFENISVDRSFLNEEGTRFQIHDLGGANEWDTFEHLNDGDASYDVQDGDIYLVMAGIDGSRSAPTPGGSTTLDALWNADDDPAVEGFTWNPPSVTGVAGHWFAPLYYETSVRKHFIARGYNRRSSSVNYLYVEGRQEVANSATNALRFLFFCGTANVDGTRNRGNPISDENAIKLEDGNTGNVLEFGVTQLSWTGGAVAFNIDSSDAYDRIHAARLALSSNHHLVMHAVSDPGICFVIGNTSSGGGNYWLASGTGSPAIDHSYSQWQLIHDHLMPNVEVPFGGPYPTVSPSLETWRVAVWFNPAQRLGNGPQYDPSDAVFRDLLLVNSWSERSKVVTSDPTNWFSGTNIIPTQGGGLATPLFSCSNRQFYKRPSISPADEEFYTIWLTDPLPADWPTISGAISSITVRKLWAADQLAFWDYADNSGNPTLDFEVGMSEASGTDGDADGSYPLILRDRLFLGQPYQAAEQLRDSVLYSVWQAGNTAHDLFDPLNRISLAPGDDTEVRGLAELDGRLVVFKDQSVFWMRIEEANQAAIEADILPGAPGLLAIRSILKRRGHVYYLAESGIHEISPAGALKEISFPIRDELRALTLANRQGATSALDRETDDLLWMFRLGDDNYRCYVYDINGSWTTYEIRRPMTIVGTLEDSVMSPSAYDVYADTAQTDSYDGSTWRLQWHQQGAPWAQTQVTYDSNALSALTTLLGTAGTYTFYVHAKVSDNTENFADFLRLVVEDPSTIYATQSYNINECLGSLEFVAGSTPQTDYMNWPLQLTYTWDGVTPNIWFAVRRNWANPGEGQNNHLWVDDVVVVRDPGARTMSLHTHPSGRPVLVTEDRDNADTIFYQLGATGGGDALDQTPTGNLPSYQFRTQNLLHDTPYESLVTQVYFRGLNDGAAGILNLYTEGTLSARFTVPSSTARQDLVFNVQRDRQTSVTYAPVRGAYHEIELVSEATTVEPDEVGIGFLKSATARTV